MRITERLNGSVLIIVMLCMGNVFASEEGPCFELNWDTVNGGSHIDLPTPGECEYEIDIDLPTESSYLGYLIPQDFLASEEHWLSFKFNASLFNRSYEGSFRILSLLADDGLMFSIDLYWGQLFAVNGDLFLEAKFYPAVNGPFQRDPTIAVTPSPFDVSLAFDQQIQVLVKLTESSGPSANDGSIELWIDGEWVATAFDMDFDWPNDRPPKAVRYGVVEIFETSSSGKLKVTPVQPAPYNSIF